MARRRGLRILLVTAGLGLAAGLGLLTLGHRGPKLAPDFALPTLSGQAMRLSAFRGKVVVLNLWTTWCAPCREEMPSMERLYDRLRDRDFQLLAVSQDEGGPGVVEAFVRELGLTFPVLVDPDRQVGDRYGVWGYPETFVIDRHGYVVERVIGPRDWSSREAVAALETLIAADGPPAPSAPGGPS
jgi:peroxiredoxin